MELKTSWFSGHTMSARGIYQDKSTSRAASYHLKFLLKSPSFREINVDFQFYRNNNLLKIDTKVRVIIVTGVKISSRQTPPLIIPKVISLFSCRDRYVLTSTSRRVLY